MRSLRVALCFGTYPPERNGGADSVARLAAALAAAGHEVHVLTSRGEPADETLHGVRVHRIVDDWTVRGGRAARRRVRTLLRRERVDVLHVFFPDSVLQGRYQSPALLAPRDTKVVTTWWNLGLGRRSPLAIKVSSLALLARSSVLSSHDPVYVAALERLVLRRKPVGWLPVGSNFAEAATRQRADSIPTVGFFGQLDFTRGVDTLFDAVARLSRPEIRLRMLGSAGRPERYEGDPEFVRLLDLPQRLGIADQVEWTGFLDDREVPQALADLDLCVLPYRRNSLGRSALAAAFAAGAPVVLGGYGERVAPLEPGRHVALVEPDDAEALAQAIANLLDDPTERERLAAGSREAAAFFAWPRIAELAVELYREALR
ncbi:MAG: glycosyltransferase family 4 protein [Gaiellaceae bacterium]